MKDFSNVTAQSLGENGYCKFPNGLLLQWGYSGMTSFVGNITIYLPVSYYDTNYSICMTYEVESNEISLHAAMLYSRQRTYFSAIRKFVNSAAEGNTSRAFIWIAIGRWR